MNLEASQTAGIQLLNRRSALTAGGLLALAAAGLHAAPAAAGNRPFPVPAYCLRARLQPGATDRVVEFVESLADGRRNSLALEAIRDEGIITESVFLERTGEGDFLLIHMRTEDFLRTQQVLANSTNPVDVEFRNLAAETIAGIEVLTTLLVLEQRPRHGAGR